MQKAIIGILLIQTGFLGVLTYCQVERAMRETHHRALVQEYYQWCPLGVKFQQKEYDLCQDGKKRADLVMSMIKADSVRRKIASLGYVAPMD